MSPRTRRIPTYVALALLVSAAAAVLVVRWAARAVPTVTEQQVRDAITTTIDRESPAAFLVTGRLTMSVRTRVENSRVFLPGIVDLDLGTTRATVRVPGRVSYGFQVDSLRPEMIRMQEDGAIEIALPPLEVYSTEADLSRLEVETDRGWARLGRQRDQVERRALVLVEDAMRNQAVHHLGSSYQPRINAARALRRLLTPALKGLGMADPQFEFRLGEDLVITPGG